MHSRKNSLLVVFTVLILIFLISCKNDNVSIENVIFDEAQFTDYKNLDEFDLNDYFVTIYYSDNTNETVNIELEWLQEADISKLSVSGVHDLIFKIDNFSFTIQLKLLDNDEFQTIYQIYNLGVSSLLIDLSYEEWLDSIRGENGQPPSIGSNGNWFIGSIDTGVKAAGIDGEDGQTPNIGSNGNWFIGSIDTGVKAVGIDGEDGQTPNIGSNGNWFIGSVDTGIRALGQNGEDGLSAYEIYLLYYPTYTGDESQWIMDIVENNLSSLTHSVTFVLNDLSIENSINPMTIKHNSYIQLPVPVLSGHTFLGWYTGDTVNDIKFSNYNPILSDLTLYAKWELNSGTIAQDPGNTGGDEAIALIEGNKITFSGSIDWYSEDLELNRAEGNRVGVMITAPEGFDASGATVKIGDTIYTDLFTSEQNYFWWYPLVTEAGQVFTAEITWKVGSKQTFTVEIAEDAILEEEHNVNLFVTLGTLPTLYAGLVMFEEEVESYAWYYRSGTFDTNYLPDYVNLFPTIQGVGGANSTLDFRVIQTKVEELYAQNPHTKFNLYIDDLRPQLYLDLLVAVGIKEDRYQVYLLSDGTGTYNGFNTITDAEWLAMPSNWDGYLNEYMNDVEFKWGYNTAALASIWRDAAYLSQQDNFEYWLQFPEYLINNNSTDLMDSKVLMNLVAKNPHEMYVGLSAEKRAMFEQAVLSNAPSDIEFYNEQFLGRDKDILIITGTNLPGIPTNVTYIDQVIADFGDTHYMYFKPHPAYPPNTELLEYFAANNIIVLPHRTPMEAIMWMFPDVFVGGYNSSLFMSSFYGQTLFFFGNIGSPLTYLRDFGHFDNVIYYQPMTPLAGTIAQDPGNTGGDEAIALIEGNKITFSGSIDWYSEDLELNRAEGNRVGVMITAPEGFDASGATVKIGDTIYTDLFTSEQNYFWWYPLVTEAGQVFTAEITWKVGSKQTFTVEIAEDAILDPSI
jgi:uncharacterized repeat protein (TIGR02543 family)